MGQSLMAMLLEMMRARSKIRSVEHEVAHNLLRMREREKRGDTMSIDSVKNTSLLYYDGAY